MLNADALNQLRQLKSELQTTKPSPKPARRTAHQKPPAATPLAADAPAANAPTYPGTVKATQGRFGFVALAEGRDVYLPAEQMQKVLPGDQVEVVLVDGENGKPAAEVTRLLNSSLKQFVGQYLIHGNGHFVAADVPGLSRWLFVPPKWRKDAKAGDYVACQLHQHPFKTGNAQAMVLRVLGQADQAGIERTYTLAKYQLQEDWPEALLKDVSEWVGQLDDPGFMAAQCAGRKDLTQLPFVTIDAPSTQDMDDALYAETNETGWTLHVAIADPCALIPLDSPLETLARQRATTLYLPGKPNPMLPEQLSTQRSSLLPQVERLALVASIRVAQTGDLIDFEFTEAVIRSHAKLSYEQVAAFLDNRLDDALKSQPDQLLNSLKALGQLCHRLRQWRDTHALLMQDKADYRLRLDEQGKVRCIDKQAGTTAHQLVEEAMVLANRCAAQFLRQRIASGQLSAGLFINHRGLRPERLENVRELLRLHAPDLAQFDPASAEGYAHILRMAATLDSPWPIAAIINRQLERSEVAGSPAPHFGMGLDSYTTFTSPIRKYSDFYVHRLIKHQLAQDLMSQDLAVQDLAARHPDETPPAPQLLNDQQIDELQQMLIKNRAASNEMEQWLKAQYASQLAGQTLEGTIVRTLPAGFYVRLQDTGIEGFVSAQSLGEKFSFDLVTLSLKSKTRSFLLEQTLLVTLGQVDLTRRQIQFLLAEDEAITD